MNEILNPEVYQERNAAYNSFDGLPMDTGGDLQPGRMYAANSTRFAEATFQQALTAYAVGWKDEDNLDALLEFLAPGVQVDDRFEYAEWPNAEAFMADASAEDLRAIGSEFGRIDYTSTKTTARTFNRGLTIRVDADQVKKQPNWEQMYVGRIMARLKRNEIRRAYALLIAAATNNAKTWDTTAAKDPDQDVITARLAYRAAVGLSANKTLYTDGAWNKRGLSHRAQNTAGGFASAGMTPDQLGQVLGSSVYVSGERYQNAAATKALLAGSSEVVLMYMARSGMTVDDPSNIKCFWTPCANSGQRFAVWTNKVGVKFTDITVEHYSLTKITSSLGIQSLTIS